MDELGPLTIPTIVTRLLISAAVGGLIGYERRLRHKAIGVAGMLLVADLTPRGRTLAVVVEQTQAASGVKPPRQAQAGDPRRS